MNIWKLSSETTDGKVITSVIIAVNPKEALEVFKAAITDHNGVIRVKQLGAAASNLRSAEVVLTTVA